MYHIYSTLANSNRYVRYSSHSPRGVNVAEHSVTIKGGSGINQKHIATSLGIHTSISDEDMEWLQNDSHFKRHVKRGYITFRKSEVHPEVMAADMATRQWTKGKTGNVIREDAFPIAPQDFNGKALAEGLTSLDPKVNKKTKAV